MGYLSITPHKTNPASPRVWNRENTYSEGSPHAKGVIAEFKIGNRAFKYAISGISLNDIPSISLLYPCLRQLLTSCALGELRQEDPNYELPRQLTFSQGENTTEKIILTSSFRALATLLDDIVARRISGIKSLRIDNEAQRYSDTNGTWRKSGFQLVQLAFPKIQPLHFHALSALQVKITSKSAVVISGINDLFARGCFPNLKSLKLPIEGVGVCWHEEGWLKFTGNREQRALQNLLENGLMQANLPFLEELRLPILLSYGLPAALAFLRKVYPTLKKLEVDSIYPTAVYKGAKVDWEQQHHEQYYMSGAYQDKWVNHSYTQEHYAAELEIFKQTEGPTLVSVLKEIKDQSQLQSIEIHAEGVNGKDYDQTDYRAIVELMLSDSLPNLKSLSMGPKSRYFSHYSDITAEVNDTTELRNAVIAKNVHLKLEHLGLTMPDQKGYQPWLDQMVECVFPKLESFHYMIPRKIKEEPSEVHEQRQEKALQTILTAVKRGKLPALTSVVFQGLGDGIYAMLNEQLIPSRLKSIISEIDNAVTNQRQSGYVHDDSSVSLSTHSASSSNGSSSEEEDALAGSSTSSLTNSGASLSEVNSEEEYASSSSPVTTPPQSPNRSPEAQVMESLKNLNTSFLFTPTRKN